MNDYFIDANEYGLPVLTKNNVKIEWVNLNEGNDGDYDPSDKNDANLLRFDVSHKVNDEWEAVKDGSYCTRVQASTDNQKLLEHLIVFMDIIYDDVSKHGKAKRLCESLSWTE